MKPGWIHTPFTVLIDKQEKAPWVFSDLRARSFIDKDQREYSVRTERAYLGIGKGDYTIQGFESKIAIERKSMKDFQGTLLGWPVDVEEAAESAKPREINRRGRFKRELAILAGMQNKAVIVEAPLGKCLEECPQWGVRSAGDNAKYLYATYLAWQQEFPVPWIFCDDREMAAVTAFRIMEQFWDRQQKERRGRKKRNTGVFV